MIVFKHSIHLFASAVFASAVFACLSSSLGAQPARAVEPFSAVDTSVLMGSPDPLPPLEVEPAFPHLRFEFPVSVTHAGDGTDRLFVVSQDGYIYVFPNRRETKDKRLFLDLSAQVGREKFEEGLLGLTFHPNYRDNGEFFVYYSVRPLATRVSRFRVSAGDPQRADEASEEVILEVEQPFWNHNGGTIEFGPDGFLYVGLGDGGKANDPHLNGQNPKTLLGSILRLDVDGRDPGKGYAVPQDNPFVDYGDAARPEIWALGIRNPWKLCFDRETGALWVADVGQNLWEEVNIIVRGGNYGWNVREGMHPFDPQTTPPSFAKELIDPVWEYHHSEGRSITGGAVYRGERLPEIRGWYLCADWVSGRIWALESDGKTVSSSLVVAQAGYTVSAFGEDEGGEVYFTAFDEPSAVGVSKTVYGRLYRFKKAEKAPAYAAFPRSLSATGLFSSTRDHVPAAGLIPYDVNVPLWSDHASKERFLALPGKAAVTFSEQEPWEFPVGTVAVKTFHLETVRGDPESRRRLETRLLVHNPRGWDGYTYLWNDEQTDATLLRGALERSYRVKTSAGEEEQLWYFPSSADCKACHTKMKKDVLGLNTRQLNRKNDFGDAEENQLDALARLEVWRNPPAPDGGDRDAYPAWGASDASQERLAKAYLDVNCSMCHLPGGTGMSLIDLRYHASLEESNLLGRAPTIQRLGPPGAKIVVPGDPQSSEILHRMAHRGPGQMPPLATHTPDELAQEIVRGWIAAMKAE